MGKAISKAQELAAAAAVEAAEETNKATTEGVASPETAAPAAEELAPAISLEELEEMELPGNAPEAEEARAPFRIADDRAADWAVRKIAEEKQELDRLKQLAEEQISKIEEKLEAAERRFQNNTNFLTMKLSEFFRTVPHKETKTKRSYRLLSGTLTLKIGGSQMKQDDDKLVEYLKKSGNNELIKTEEKPMWGEFKKRLEIMGGSVVDKTTGEIVEGVQIIEKPDVFSVDV